MYTTVLICIITLCCLIYSHYSGLGVMMMGQFRLDCRVVDTDEREIGCNGKLHLSQQLILEISSADCFSLNR